MDIRAFNVPEFMKKRISFARLIAPANDGPSQCWFCCIWCLVGLLLLEAILHLRPNPKPFLLCFYRLRLWDLPYLQIFF